MKESAGIVIAGAGVIGLCSALWLQGEGHDVLLIDRDEPGSGASFGNAGVLATYACVPLGTPSVLKSLPQLLFKRSSPLSISLSALPRLTPWLVRFAHASLQANARRNATHLSALLANALSSYQQIIAAAGAQSLLRHGGVLHIFRNERDLQASAWDIALRRELGINQIVLDRAGIQAAEPALPPHYGSGILYPDAVHLTDPGELMRLLARAFVTKGGTIVRGDITSLHHSSKGVQLSGEGGICLRARTAVIACGAWSANLALQVGDRFPLETERGYHVEFPTQTPPLSRPVCAIEQGFYLTPMNGRLRAAGTVELSNLKRPPSPHRLHMIESATRKLFPHLGKAQSRWLGFRPSLPDSLPVIGRSRRARNVIYAFGHGHLGVTLAAETARIVAKVIANDHDPADEAAGWSPSRFL